LEKGRHHFVAVSFEVVVSFPGSMIRTSRIEVRPSSTIRKSTGVVLIIESGMAEGRAIFVRDMIAFSSLNIVARV
jgi:hypothetical protein